MKKLIRLIVFGALALALGVCGNALNADAAVHTLSVNVSGTGGGTVLSLPTGISCGADCSEDLEEGTLVSLWPMPAPGSHFSGWSGGGCSSTGQCIVPISGDATVTATFNKYVSSLGNLHISVTYFANHALKPNGTLWGWGQNYYGQLGDGTTTSRFIPTRIGTDSDWASIWSSSFAIKTDGTLWGWGRNDYGQVGDGTSGNSRLSPVIIGTDTDWVMVAGGSHTIALKSNGTLYAWGRNNAGALGLGDQINRSSPVQVGTDTDWVMVAAGSGHSLALKSDGTLWAWGDNGNGQLGDGTTSYRLTPVQVGTDTDWMAVWGLGRDSYAIKTDGTLWAWGQNRNAQLGDGTTTDRHVPTKIGTDTDWVSVGAGGEHAIFLKSDGSLYLTGVIYVYNEWDNCPANPPFYVPTPLHVGTTWSLISSGRDHDIAIRSDGTLLAWGAGVSGQLGADPPVMRTCSPVPVFFPQTPPTAHAGPDQNVSCGGPGGSSVTLDGSQSSDPEGDVLTYEWTGPFGTATGVGPTVTVPLGLNTITLEVDDGMGGTDTDTVDITVSDTTPPSTSAILDGTMGQNDWFVSDVLVTLMATDDCSGVREIHYTIDDVEQPVVYDSTAVFILDQDGAHTITYWAVDNADNVEQVASTPVNTETTPPDTTSTPSGTQGGGGNYTSCVDVELQTTSASGTEITEYSDDGGQTWQEYTGQFTICTDGETNVSYKSTSNAGNVEEVQTLTINIDQTPPEITADVSPAANGSGWHNADVTVTFTCNDATSGIETCEDPITVTTEGAGQVVTGTAVDVAGISNSTSVTLDIDLTIPEITVTGITEGTKYPACSPPTPANDITDALSGLSDSSAVLTGGNANGVGEYSYAVTATDVADNNAAETVSYEVVYTFEGFLIPVSHGKPFNQGSTIPVKFRLNDGCGNPVTVATATLSLQFMVGGVPIGDPVLPEGTFLYDSEGDHYIYNLDTTSLDVGTWLATVSLDDTETHSINIELK